MAFKMIGIVGGMGSYTEIDLIKKIYDTHNETRDQNQAPISILSIPHKIVDRTEYLLGKTNINPGIAIAEITSTLISNGAEVIGIPCNTAHAEAIFKLIRNSIPSHCILINMIEEVGLFLSRNHPEIKLVGVLSTSGTAYSKIYPEILGKYKLEVIQPSDDIQSRLVHPSIYDKDFGIKSFSNPVKQKAKENLVTAVAHLCREGTQAIILGCTEISLALTEDKIENCILVDATNILASALVRESRNKNFIKIPTQEQLPCMEFNKIA